MAAVSRGLAGGLNWDHHTDQGYCACTYRAYRDMPEVIRLMQRSFLYHALLYIHIKVVVVS